MGGLVIPIYDGPGLAWGRPLLPGGNPPFLTMPSFDTIVVTLLILGAVSYLAQHYVRRWKSPKACGSGNCGCTARHSKLFAKDTSLR